jgi:hypothetical protein
VLAFCYGYWLAGIIFIFMGMISQAELSNAKLVAYIYSVRANLAIVNPELANAALPELIQAVQSIECGNREDKLEIARLLNLLIDLERSNFSI